jgi:polar amino acid transport system permease protein
VSEIFRILTPENLVYLGRGAVLSIVLAVGALLIGVVLGILGALGRISRVGVLRGIATVYVQVIRGTPMLLQITFFFLALPSIYRSITGAAVRPDPIIVGLIAMGINSGAYTTELIRSGIQGIDRGQMEAARSLGLSYGHAMRYVILPQAFKRIIPPLVSEFIMLVKDSSLVSTIGVLELLSRSKALNQQYYSPVVPLLAASAIYLAITLCVSALARKLERRLSVSD